MRKISVSALSVPMQSFDQAHAPNLRKGLQTSNFYVEYGIGNAKF